MGFRKLLRQPQSIFAFIYRHKYTALFVYIYTLNAKNTINNSYINFRIVFPVKFQSRFSKSFLLEKFQNRFSKSFLLEKFQNRFSKSFLLEKF